MMRRRLSAVAVLGMLAASVFFAGPAGAAPTPTSVPGTCGYPPELCQAHIFSSTTAPTPGQHIEASGKDYHPNESVDLTIGGIHVGTAHTDGNGNFDPDVVVPASLTGDQPLTGRGASGAANDVDSVVLHIQTTGAGGSTSSGGLASTGVKIAAFSALGVALLVGGVAFVMAGRRRRSAAHGS